MTLVPQSDLSRASTNADSWGRYYTADWISQRLVNAIDAVDPKLVVELGAGHGALTTAAVQRWAGARFVTVDADHTTKGRLKTLVRKVAHTHHIHDALDESLQESIGLGLDSVDVALCNPPYVRPRWRASFSSILEDAGLSGALQSVHDAGADLLFIAQNLRLLRKRGTLGLILPDGLITGEKYRGVRSVLLREHSIQEVVQLPRRVFPGTEAQTYLVILAKRSGATECVTLREMNPSGMISSALQVPAELGQRRLDYSFHSRAMASQAVQKSSRRKLRRVGDFAIEIVRGSVSSNQIDDCAWPVFHSGDFPTVSERQPPTVKSKFRLTKRAASSAASSVRIAEGGDILIARVGRNLQDKVCFLDRGACVISDCVFALRVKEEVRNDLLTFLTSSMGRETLAAQSHGVGARYLSRSDLLELRF